MFDSVRKVVSNVLRVGLICCGDRMRLGRMSRINARPPGEGKKGSRVRQALRRRDGDLCWICGAEMDFDAPAGRTPLSATRDHIIERRGGGRDNLANQRLAHAKCNNDRSARVPGGAPKKRVFLRLQFGDFEVILVKRYH